MSEKAPVIHITISDSYSLQAQQFLKLQLSATFNLTTTSHPTAEDLQKTQVLLTRSHTVVDERLLGMAPLLQVVGTATSGRDHIDEKSCQLRGIHVVHAPDANTQSAAEHTLLLILNLLKRLDTAQRSLRTGGWKTALRRGRELRGQWVGIVGLGRVGTRVAQLVQSFGAQVVAYDPYIPQKHFSKHNVISAGFTEVLKQSEILTLHVPLTTETKNMFNQKSLGLLNESCLVINTSRGGVLNENDLLHLLSQNRLGGAAIDVYHQEPFIPHSRWLKTPHLLLSPHMGAFTDEAFQRASMDVAAKVVQFFRTR